MLCRTPLWLVRDESETTGGALWAVCLIEKEKLMPQPLLGSQDWLEVLHRVRVQQGSPGLARR